jgi:hypothetical protein
MAFDPTNITGLAAWFDASDAATLFTDTAGVTPVSSDEDLVRRWEDKSGEGVVVTEATNAPAYRTAVQDGKSIVRFDGTDDKLAKGSGLFGSAVTEIGVFIVGKQTMKGAYMLSMIGASHLALYGVRQSQWGAYITAGGATDLRKLDRQLLSDDISAFHCMAMLWRGNDIVMSRLDGKESHGRVHTSGGVPVLRTFRPNPIASLTLTTNLSFGNWSTIFQVCDIAEVLIYSGTEIMQRYQEAEAFLIDKWGLAYTTEQI